MIHFNILNLFDNIKWRQWMIQMLHRRSNWSFLTCSKSLVFSCKQKGELHSCHLLVSLHGPHSSRASSSSRSVCPLISSQSERPKGQTSSHLRLLPYRLTFFSVIWPRSSLDHDNVAYFGPTFGPHGQPFLSSSYRVRRLYLGQRAFGY